MLEPYDGKLSRTVLRRESGSNPADLADKIHTLESGNTLTLTTRLGTRTYVIASVEKVSVNDSSGTAATTDHRVTLYTCVMDQPEYRWCVTAVQQAG